MLLSAVQVTDIEPNFKLNVPEYRSRFPSTGLLLGIYLGPGYRVQVQVPEYREIGSISVTHTVYAFLSRILIKVENKEYFSVRIIE